MARARVLQCLNLAFWVLVIGASIRFVFPKWKEFELSTRLSTLAPSWLLGAFLGIAVQYLVVFAIWRRLLALLGSRAPSTPLFRAFGLSLLPKYVPGKLLGPGLRARLAVEAGLSYPVVVGSLLWETGLGLASATLITGIGLASGISRGLAPAARWLVLMIPSLGLFGLVLMRVPPVRRFAARWLHPEVARHQSMALISVLLAYVGGWLLSGAAHWMLARAIAPIPVGQWMPLLVALSVSWAVGMLSIFAPAGLGVREGVLFIFAQGLMGGPNALLFVTLSRLMLFFSEVLLTVICLLISVSRVSPTVTPPDAEGR